jgi:hypothetical protein
MAHRVGPGHLAHPDSPLPSAEPRKPRGSLSLVSGWKVSKMPTSRVVPAPLSAHSDSCELPAVLFRSMTRGQLMPSDCIE